MHLRCWRSDCSGARSWGGASRRSPDTTTETKRDAGLQYPAYIAIIPLLLRGGAVWQLVGLITRRSQVQILPPLPSSSIDRWHRFVAGLGPRNPLFPGFAIQRHR